VKRAIQALLFVLFLFAAHPAKAQSTPCPSGQTCGGSVTFTVTFGAPGAPSAVSPNTAVAGSTSPVTLTLTAGTGSTFNSTMTVLWCEITPTPCTTATSLATTFVSSTSITAVVPASMLASSGTFAIYLEQPTGGHAQVTMPTEILATTDQPVCTLCENMPAEVLQTVDFVSALKG